MPAHVTQRAIQGIAQSRAKPREMPDRALLETTAGRVVAGLAALLVLGVLAGLALLWPDGSQPRRTQGPAAGAIESAHVVSIAPGACERFAGPAAGSPSSS